MHYLTVGAVRGRRRNLSPIALLSYFLGISPQIYGAFPVRIIVNLSFTSVLG